MEQNPTKKCSQCYTEIPAQAKKCPNCQSDLRNWFVKRPLISLIIILATIGLLSAMTSDSSEPAPVAPTVTQESDNDAAFCATVGQYLAIVNGDQVSVTDNMVVAGLEVIAEKAQGTRFEATANRALAQGNASDTQGLITSLHELARSCGLE
jgi:RNA polymerase subunit RPABC4/transcription elongation factor Spt4